MTKSFLYSFIVGVFLLLFGGGLVAQNVESQFNPYAVNEFQYVFVDGGAFHSVALRCNGTVACWGENSSGQLGDGTTTNRHAPVTVVNCSGDTLKDIVAVDAGADHTMALRDDGTVFVWGDNGEGELGQGAAGGNSDCAVPIVDSDLDSTLAIEAGANFSLAIRSDSAVLGWGQNNDGQLGNTALGSPVPEPDTPMANLDTGAIALAAGGCHSTVLLVDKTAKSTGCDQNGQLGNDQNSTGQTEPVYVGEAGEGPLSDPDSLTGIIGIDAGSRHGIAVHESGRVYTWGSVDAGSIGPELARPGTGTPAAKVAGEALDGDNPDDTLENVVAVGAGTRVSAALTRDSTLKMWGRDDDDVLGICGGGDRDTAVTHPFFANKEIRAMGAGVTAPGNAGGTHGLALLYSDTMFAWGSNGSGQVGNNTTSTSVCPPDTVERFSLGMLIAEAGNDTAACGGDSVQLGRGIPPEDTANFDYVWTPTTGLSDPTLPNPKAALSPSNTITIDYTLFKLPEEGAAVTVCLRPDTVSVTYNATTQADFSSSAPVCESDSVDFVNTGSSGGGKVFSWDFGAGASPATSNLENPKNIAYDTFGLKEVTLMIDDTLCGTSDSETKGVNIYEEPNASFTSNAPVCEGEEVDFTNTGSSGDKWDYEWSFGADASPSSSTAENPQGITYSSPGQKIISLRIYNGNCSDIVSDTIMINSTPVAEFSSTAPTCEEDTVFFENTGTSGAASYTWDFGSGATPSTSTAENPGGVVYSTSGTKDIMLAVSDGGCTDTMRGSITIHDKPTVSFTSTAPACENESINFTNTGSDQNKWSYSWDFGAGADPSTSTAEDPQGVEYISSGSKTVTLTISDENCSARDTGTIQINATPEADFTSDAPKCEEDTVSFTYTGSEGGSNTYDWRFGSGSAPATSTNKNPTNIQYSTSGTKTVQLVVTNSSTGCTDTIGQNITIDKKPTADFSANLPACAGEPLDFTNTGTSGANWSYSWSFGAGSQPSSSVDENPSDISYQTGGDKIVSFTITDGTCSDIMTDTLGIDTLPNARAGVDTTICSERKVQIGTPAVSGYTYQWRPASTLDDATKAEPIASPEATLTTYHLRVTDSNTGCVGRDSIQVTMLTSMVADAGEDQEICFGDSAQIGTAPIEGQTYQWSPTQFLEDPNSATTIARPDSTIQYTVSVIDTSPANCDPIKDQVRVTVHPLPDAEAGEDQEIMRGEEIELVASGGLQYEWYPTEGLSNPDIHDPMASPDSTTTYKVWVTDIRGCVNTDTVRVKIHGRQLFIPSAFTPNNDGKNDILYVRSPGFQEGTFTFEIYDQWGELVFHTENQDKGWDGRKQSSQNKKMPEGAYVWFLKGTLKSGKKIDKQGVVNLIR